jgi:hypothetical protein
MILNYLRLMRLIRCQVNGLIDEAGETLTKKQKVKHPASIRTFHGAAPGRYIQEKISPE